MSKKYALLSLLLSANLFAAPAKAPTMTQTTTCTGASCNKTVTTTDMQLPAISCLNKNGPFAFASFLYWQSGFNDAIITSEATPVGTGGVAFDLNDQSLDFDFNPGVKAGLGWNLEHDGWSPIVLWTYMHSSPSQTWTSATPNLVTALNLPATSGLFTELLGENVPAGTNVQANWHLNFNAIDFELGKDLALSPYFLTRMFGSLKVGSVNNNLIVNYTGVSTATGAWPDQIYTASNQSWIVGPRVGSNINFGIGKNFSFMATVATYVYACIFEPEVTSGVTLPDFAGGGLLAGFPVGHHETTSQTSLEPGFDLYFGFNWGHCFPNKAYLNLSAGYEFQYYGAVINQFQSLSFNGLNASVMLDF